MPYLAPETQLTLACWHGHEGLIKDI